MFVTTKTTIRMVLIALSLVMVQSAWAWKPQPEPDYTQGEKPINSILPWNLGPIGVSAHIHYQDPRTFLIEGIQEGTESCSRVT